MSADAWVVLEPLDTVAVRDGRAFTAGVHATGRMTSPRPSTLAGAIGAAFGSNPIDVAGPVVVRRDGQRWQGVFPVPRDVVRDDNARWRLVGPAGDHAGPGDRTESLPAVQHDLDAELPQLVAGEGSSLGGWWSTVQVQRYLRERASWPRWLGDMQSAARQRDAWVPWAVEPRVGLTRHLDRTGVEGFLYATEHL